MVAPRAGVAGWARKRPRAEWLPVAVGDAEGFGGTGDGDDAAVVQPVMVGADQHQVGDKF